MPEWVLVDDLAPGPLTALSLAVGPAASLVARHGLAVRSGRLYRPGGGPERGGPGCGVPECGGPVHDGPVRDGPVRDGPVRDGSLAALSAPLDRAVTAWVRADDAARLADPGAAHVPPAAEQVRRLARVIAEDDHLGRLFDHGPAELRNRLRASRVGSVRAFLQAVETTLAEWPHLGPGGWELAEPDWGTHPEQLLGVLDLLRRAPDRPPTGASRSERLCARDRAADAVDRIVHRQRLLVGEIGRARHAAGRLVEPGDVVHLHAAELTGPVDAEAVRLRAYDHAALAALVPPSTCLGRPPSAVRWARVGDAPDAGTVLDGVPAAPGRVSGRVSAPGTPRQFVHAAGDGADEVTGLAASGPVLVIGDTGPYWVPLLPGARAVVARSGHVSSPVAAACRALLVPCVVGVTGAAALADATSVTVDGAAGTVTVAG